MDGGISWRGIFLPLTLTRSADGLLAGVLSERNVEVRRAMIEIIGWDRLTNELIRVAECADPGNDGQTIALYDLPDGMREMYAEPRYPAVYEWHRRT